MRKFKIFLKILVSSLVVLAFISGIYVFMTGPLFRITDVEITLDNKAASGFVFEKIRDSLEQRLSNLEGRFIWSVDLEKVLRTVENDLRIKEVKVSRSLPDRIQVNISPYTPVLNILGAKTSVLHPVARDGEILPSVPATEAPDSPILRGENFLHNDELRLKAVELVLALDETGSLSYRTVSEIYFDKKMGFQMHLQNSNPTSNQTSNMVVWVGFEDFKTRLNQAQRVVNYLQGEHMAGRIIDARYSKKVVVRLRNDP